jgi:NADP-reducing hydrogenase subunit HndB
MSTIQSLEDLQRFREVALEKKAQLARPGNVQVIIGMSSCGIAAGALETMNAIREQVEKVKIPGIYISQTGCSGLCAKEPIVQVVMDGKQKVTYGNVTPDIARRILIEHVQGGKVVQEYSIED